MNVYLLKDVENVGMSGQVVKVADGFANNFLLPRKLAKQVSKKELAFLSQRVQKIKVDQEVLSSKIAMVAQRIANIHVSIKKRGHDNDKLYGSISADEIVELLKEKDITISKKQVEFPKTIRTAGEHSVIIRLTSKLRPTLTLKVTVAQE